MLDGDWLDFVGGYYALTFEDCVELVGGEIFEGLFGAGGPGDFYCIDLGVVA